MPTMHCDNSSVEPLAKVNLKWIIIFKYFEKEYLVVVHVVVKQGEVWEGLSLSNCPMEAVNYVSDIWLVYIKT